MAKDIFGVTPDGLQKRVGTEKFRVNELKKVFFTLLNEIKNTPEEDGWHRLVIFSVNSAEVFDGLSYSERAAVLYYLRRHPNIISKLSEREKRIGGLDSMRPYVFKWVSAAEKEQLGIRATYFRNLSDEFLKKIDNERHNRSTGFLVDVCSVLEFLLGKRSKIWAETSTHNISAFSGVPIENTRAALNELLKLKLIVLAYIPCEGRRGRSRMNVYVTLTEDDYRRASAGEGIVAEQIITAKDALNEKFTFSVTNYFYFVISHFQADDSSFPKKVQKVEDKKNPSVSEKVSQVEDLENFLVSEEVPQVKDVKNSSFSEKVQQVEDVKNSSVSEKVPQVEEKKLPAQVTPPINIVMPEVSGLGKTLDDIKSCVISFTNIAESMQKSEAEKYELLKNMIQANTKQREEYDNLYNQMLAMKKILNQKDRDKDNFVKAIQDALNMMMGKIISATDEFSKIPRHLVNEQKLQDHKAQVIKIAVQTAEEIRNLANSGQ